MLSAKKTLCLILALLLAFLCTGLVACSDEMEEPVATYGDYEVRYGELRYLILTEKDAMMRTYGEAIFSSPESAAPYMDEWRARVTDKLRENYAVLAACAHYLPDLALDDDRVQDAADELIADAEEEAGGKELFYELSERYHMSESFIRFSTEVSVMEDLLRQELAKRTDIENLFDDSENLAFTDWILSGNGVYVQHIFVRNDAGEDKEANRRTAEAARQGLSDGTLSLRDAVGSAVYNQDPSNSTPYYLIRDVYDPALEAAALALCEVGDVSPVIEVADGYYVLVRLADEGNAVLGRTVSTLLSSHQWSRTESIVATFRDSVVFEWNDFGRELDWLAVV